MRPPILFHLSFLLPSLNAMLRQHWASRHDLMERLNQEVMVNVGGPTRFPRPPYERARITVTRHCVNELDQVNLVGSTKFLEDVLKAYHYKTNPLGLSFIKADDPSHCIMVARQIVEKRRTAQRTIVVVEELPSLGAGTLPPRDLFAEALEMAGAGP